MEDKKEKLVSSDKKSVRLDVKIQKRADPMVTASFLDDKKAGFTYFQDQGLTLMESIQIHFKPCDIKRPCLHFFMFLIDWALSIMFQFFHMYFFLFSDFENENNHMLHVLIGAGFTSIILFYSFSDGVRYLRSNFDKVLYLVSCLL